MSTNETAILSCVVFGGNEFVCSARAGADVEQDRAAYQGVPGDSEGYRRYVLGVCLDCIHDEVSVVALTTSAAGQLRSTQQLADDASEQEEDAERREGPI